MSVHHGVLHALSMGPSALPAMASLAQKNRAAVSIDSCFSLCQKIHIWWNNCQSSPEKVVSMVTTKHDCMTEKQKESNFSIIGFNLKPSCVWSSFLIMPARHQCSNKRWEALLPLSPLTQGWPTRCQPGCNRPATSMQPPTVSHLQWCNVDIEIQKINKCLCVCVFLFSKLWPLTLCLADLARCQLELTELAQLIQRLHWLEGGLPITSTDLEMRISMQVSPLWTSVNVCDSLNTEG